MNSFWVKVLACRDFACEDLACGGDLMSQEPCDTGDLACGDLMSQEPCATGPLHAETLCLRNPVIPGTGDLECGDLALGENLPRSVHGVGKP